MTLFNKAKIKLTIWYTLIITVIMFSLSAVTYYGVTTATRRALSIQKTRMEHRIGKGPNVTAEFPRPVFEEQTLKDVQNGVLTQLVKINALILVATASLSYFLAGKTLRPIEEMVDEQGRFISDAAHELRTPITALKTELEVTLRDKKPSIQKAVTALKGNLKEVNRLEVLSESLLSESRYQKDKLSTNFQAVDLKVLIEGVVEKMDKQAKAKKIAIRCKLTSVDLKGDESSLAELLTLLLDNAIKYSPSKSKIKVTLKQVGKDAEIKVVDKGVGIRKTDLPYIFNRFYRADQSRTNSKANGFGLGLSIAKNIVDLHNGNIKVVSELGKGTSFTVTLPLS